MKPISPSQLDEFLGTRPPPVAPPPPGTPPPASFLGDTGRVLGDTNSMLSQVVQLTENVARIVDGIGGFIGKKGLDRKQAANEQATFNSAQPISEQAKIDYDLLAKRKQQEATMDNEKPPLPTPTIGPPKLAPTPEEKKSEPVGAIPSLPYEMSRSEKAEIIYLWFETFTKSVKDSQPTVTVEEFYDALSQNKERIVKAISDLPI